MKKLLILVAIVTVLTIPSVASADGVFTPFLGVSFGSDKTEDVTTYGFSLAGMAGGVFGIELDVAQTAQAKTNTLFAANSRATTVMGNIIVGIPLGPVRPYGVGGLGWMRTKLTDPDGSGDGIKSDGLGFNMGGGLMGFFTDHVGMRVDIRYIRAVTSGDSFLDFDFENFNFWRFTGGLALRF